MNAELLKRLVRAIADGSQVDLDRLAHKVVEEEREKGHARLAEDLQSILKKARKPSQSNGQPPRVDSERTIRELPISKRQQELLVTIVMREALEHHMVLAPAIEERFARIEREYAARERLAAYGLKPRKTILLYGAPGCGKSLGAKRLAWNTGLPLMKVRFDALISSYFGESASNLRAVFDAARERPYLLLLDECDFIARSRTASKDIGEASRIVNTLLQLMEEYDAPGLLVATTNIEHSLDEALFRRFDDVFHIPKPGSDEIASLLKLTLSSLNVSNLVDWNDLVRELDGLSAASVVKIAQEAAKTAVLGAQKTIDQKHLQNAIAEIKSHDQETIH